MSKGTVLKDSYYKQRLVQSNSLGLYDHNNNSNTISLNIDNDDDDQDPIITIQQQQLDMKKFLSNFNKTSQNSNYAYLNFICTHKRLSSLYVFYQYLKKLLLQKINKYSYLEKIDISYNNLKTLKFLTGLLYLIEIKATNNHLKNILNLKQIPLYLHTLDLSYNHINIIPDLSKNIYLKILKLKGNKILLISGISKNKKLKILNLSQNNIQDINGLDNLNLTQLYLSNNQIQNVKGLHKLQLLRILDLSLNRIIKLAGLVGLISLRLLILAKNSIQHIRQIQYFENMAYLSVLDLCYNPLQNRKYYRLQCLYKLPMLQTLDGVQVMANQILEAETFYGLDVEEKCKIFQQILPQQSFIDRRIHRSQLADHQTDSDNQNVNFIDEYQQNGKVKSYSNKSRNNSKGFNTSKRSGFSKQSKKSYHSKS